MARENAVTTSLGSALLAVPLLFIAVNVLKYELGVSVPWNPFDAVFEGGGHTTLSSIFNALIVFGPVAGLVVLLAPLTRIALPLSRNGIAFTISIRRGGPLTLGVIAAAFTVIAVMGAYVVAENLSCVLGQAVTC